MRLSYDSTMRAVSTGLPQFVQCHEQPDPAAEASSSITEQPPPPKRQEVDSASASSLETPPPFCIFGKHAWRPCRRSPIPPPQLQSPPLPPWRLPRGSVKRKLDEPKIDATPPLLNDSIHTLKNGEVYSGLRVWRNDDTRIANVFVCLDGPPPPSSTITQDPFDAMCKAIPAGYSSTMVLSIHWDENLNSKKPWQQNIA